MRVLVPVIIVTLLIIGALIFTRMQHRTSDRHKELNALRRQVREQRSQLAQIEQTAETYRDAAMATAPSALDTLTLAETVLGVIENQETYR